MDRNIYIYTRCVDILYILDSNAYLVYNHSYLKFIQHAINMSKNTVLVIDGYIDEPAALGVPPYISPMIRAIAGAAIDAGVDRVKYVSIDMIRNNYKIPAADISVVLSGNTVPGKYLRSMPMSHKELSQIVPQLKG